MKKFIFFNLIIFSLLIYHFYAVHSAKKSTALEILDALHIYERETKPDEITETGVLVFSPIKYQRRTAIMDCENLIYEKYRLWE